MAVTMMLRFQAYDLLGSKPDTQDLQLLQGMLKRVHDSCLLPFGCVAGWLGGSCASLSYVGGQTYVSDCTGSKAYRRTGPNSQVLSLDGRWGRNDLVLSQVLCQALAVRVQFLVPVPLVSNKIFVDIYNVANFNGDTKVL